MACANAGRGFKTGLAGIAKHALISPSDLLQHLQAIRGPIVSREPQAIQSAATRSIEIKLVRGKQRTIRAKRSPSG